jgi:CubicO group peptidase (beta-lactamase class C family)
MKKIAFFLLFPVWLYGQQLPEATLQKIDSLFKSYTAKSPGCAVAIMQKGEIVFSKGYGIANLEYSIPITPNTIFHIASESKQYVAFCILLLEKEGKLSVDDDIRKYLDFVPDFGHTIRISHLIYHTSGLRDQWQLLANAGWQIDDVITQEHVIKLVSKQKALNFIPGEEQLYCNTGYTLLAEIVRKVSGLSLRAFADKYIFQPLGMKDSHFNDDYQEIVPNRAYSYFPKGYNSYQNAVLSYSIVGATSLLTTVLDETKWVRNLETGVVGGKDLVAKMLQTGTLNDGRKLNYAYALSIDHFKGWTLIGHGGGDAGFRTFAARIPEKELQIVVFSNYSNANPGGLVRDIAALLVPDSKEEKKPVTMMKYADSNIYRMLQGRYYSERGETGEFTWENGKFYSRKFGISVSGEIKLRSVGNNRYAMAENGPFLLLDGKAPSAPVSEFKIENSTNTLVFKRQPVTSQNITNEFAGRYYNDETESFYNITEKSGSLTLENRKFSNTTLTNIAPDQFTDSHWWMSHIRFLRNDQGKIIAFEVNAGRILHLRYDKLN